MKTLKEKFGQFALTREQMKMVKGGGGVTCTITIDDVASISGPCASNDVNECANSASQLCNNIISAAGSGSCSSSCTS